MQDDHEQLPQGAIRHDDGRVAWCTWAPLTNSVTLVLFTSAGRQEFAMTPEGEGYFVHRQMQVEDGLSYTF